MSRVFLFSSNTAREPYPVYPLGMAMVAAALVADGHTVHQFDVLTSGESDEALRQAVLGFKPDVVGMSLRNIDNVDSTCGDGGWFLASAKKWLDVVREVTTAPCLVGGPGFSIMPEDILEFLGADYGVAGEGERAVCELVRVLSNGARPPRISRGSGALSGTEMSAPLLVKDIVDHYQRESGLVSLQTKRGCPHNCIYCTYPSLEGRIFRLREPEEVADNVARMERDFQISHVFFTDSVFNDRRGHYLQVAEALERRKLKVRWSAFFRPDRITDAEVDLLLRSGLHAMELGTDAASDATLDGLNKGFTFADVVAFNEACVKRNIPTAHFVILGGPNETEATLKEGLNNMDRLNHCLAFYFSGIRILPGTKLLDRARDEGIIDPQAPLLKPVFYFSPGIQEAVLNEMTIDHVKARRDRVFPPTEGQMRMNVMQRFGYRGLLWDQLIMAEKAKAGRQRRAGAKP